MRFLRISWIFSKYLLFHRLTSYRKEIFGQRLKRALGELGLAFVKIGQVLSMRYDLLSRKDCAALQELLDNVNPIPAEIIIRIIEKEYSGPWNTVFKSFDAIPLGSASVSQVHRAILHDGSVVAVKVKRPDVDAQFANDIRLLKVLARLVALFSRRLRYVQIQELVQYFEAWIKQDLDFTAEVQNMKRIREQYKFGKTNFRSDLGKGVFIAPFEALCTPNIIVMDFVDGIPMNKKEAILADNRYDIEKSIKTYINAAIRNWFREDISSYIFQADPHLSNILALPYGDAANIDCGLISELTRKEAEQCRKLIIAVYMKDLDAVIRIATQMTKVDYETYGPRLRSDLEIYLEQTKDEGLGFWFLEFVKIMIKHRMKFPLFLTTFGRTNLILDGLASTYLPQKTTLDIVGEELRRQAVKELVNNLISADWLQVAYTVSEKVKESPNLITGLMDRYFDNPLQMVRDLRNAIRV